jgi:DNA-binding IclR family transcriptional regulator
LRRLARQLLAQPLRRRYTPRTLTDPRDLAAELARVRTRGHSTDDGEHHEDVHAIAAPVFQARDAVAVLAVSLTAEESAAADLGALAASVVHHAAALDAAINIGLSWTQDPIRPAERQRRTPATLHFRPRRKYTPRRL